MNISITRLIATSLLALAIPAARGDVLLEYTFPFVSGSTASPSPTTTASGLTGSDFVPNSGFEGTLGSQYGYSAIGGTVFVSGDGTGAASDGDELSEALANGYYWTFTVENTSTDAFSLGSLSFTHRWENPFTTLQAGLHAFSSASGFTASDRLIAGTISGNDTTLNTETFNFSGQTLAAGASQEYRFYMTDNSGSGARFHRINSVTLNGAAVAAVPEPGSALFCGLSLLGGLVLRRRRQHRQTQCDPEGQSAALS